MVESTPLQVVPMCLVDLVAIVIRCLISASHTPSFHHFYTASEESWGCERLETRLVIYTCILLLHILL